MEVVVQLMNIMRKTHYNNYGLLSKSWRHLLRISAALHLLFQVGKKVSSEEIEDSTVKGVVDFIRMSWSRLLLLLVKEQSVVRENVDLARDSFLSDEDGISKMLKWLTLTRKVLSHAIA